MTYSIRHLSLCLLVSLLWSLSHAEDLESFLAKLKDHPSIIANLALVEAAEKQLAAVYTPASFDLSGAYTNLNLDIPENPQAAPNTPEIPKNLVQFTANTRFRPFVFGDIADLAKQRSIQLEQAKLSYLETLSSLESQAIEAVLNIQLSEASIVLAQDALDLAEQVLKTTEIRRDKGAASETDINSSKQQVLEAKNQLRSAQVNLELAKQGLVNLLGTQDIPELPLLPRVTGTSSSVKRAEFDLALAKIGLVSSERQLYPTAQANYTWPLNDNLSELSLSLESRTLQPNVSYSYQNPKQSAGGFSAPEGVPLSALKGSFTLGVSLNISPDSLANINTATARVKAAEAGLQAALDAAELTVLSLDNTYKTALSGYSLSQEALNNAQRHLNDTTERERLGLASSLDIKQAKVALEQAQLNLRSAKLSLFQAILMTYQSYAIPPSEALK